MYVESLFTNIMEVLKDFNKLGLPEGTELFLQANLFCHYMKLWSVIEKKKIGAGVLCICTKDKKY